MPLSTPLTDKLSMQRVTADSKAAQVPARLLVEVMEAEVPAAPDGVPAVVEAEDSMVVVVEEGVKRLLINGGKNDG